MMVVDSATGQNAHPQPALLSRQLEDLAAADATVEDAIEINDLEEEGEEGSVSRPSIEAIQVGTSFGGQINGGEDLPSPLHVLIFCVLQPFMTTLDYNTIICEAVVGPI